MSGLSLADLTWPETAARSSASYVAVPVGSTEQHGPHLPLSTDTDVAVALTAGLAAARSSVLVAPPLPYGSSGEHAGFAGTLSIGEAALRSVLVELGRSADDFAGVLFVSAHGGNAAALGAALTVLRSEGRHVLGWAPTAGPGGDAHAGATETSVMLALRRSSVRTALAAAGNTAPLSALMPALVASGVHAVSDNGVLGDPAGASAAAGRLLLESWIADLVSSFDRWAG